MNDNNLNEQLNTNLDNSQPNNMYQATSNSNLNSFQRPIENNFEANNQPEITPQVSPISPSIENNMGLNNQPEITPQVPPINPSIENNMGLNNQPEITPQVPPINQPVENNVQDNQPKKSGKKILLIIICLLVTIVLIIFLISILFDYKNNRNNQNNNSNSATNTTDNNTDTSSNNNSNDSSSSESQVIKLGQYGEIIEGVTMKVNSYEYSSSTGHTNNNQILINVAVKNNSGNDIIIYGVGDSARDAVLGSYGANFSFYYVPKSVDIKNVTEEDLKGTLVYVDKPAHLRNSDKVEDIIIKENIVIKNGEEYSDAIIYSLIYSSTENFGDDYQPYMLISKTTKTVFLLN